MPRGKEASRVYMAARYRARRALAIHHLGGKCCRCDGTENLEVDHIDRTKKSMGFTRMTACGLPRFMAELAKCQLLCQPCHTAKTVQEDLGRKFTTEHGTLLMYVNKRCRCVDCKAAASSYNRAGKMRRKAEKASQLHTG